MQKNLPLIAISLIISSMGQGEPVLRSYNDQTMDFGTKQVLSAHSLEEAQSIIRDANNSGKKIRLSGNSHTTNSVILGDGDYLKTSGLNSIGDIEVNDKETTITVESGVKLGDLSDYLHEKGYSLGFAFPAYRDLTIGGLTATGSHGSSRVHTAISSQLIRTISLIQADGSLVNLDETDGDKFKAAKVSMGMLGAVYKIKLKIEPQFNLQLRSEPLEGRESLLAEKDKVNWGSVADYEAVAWFPHDDKAIKFSGTKTTQPATANGENVTLGLSDKVSIASRVVNQVLKWGRRWAFVNQLAEFARRKSLVSVPPFVHTENGKEVSSDNVVGSSNKILLSRAGALNPLFTQQDLSFAFPESHAHEVLTTIRNFSREHNYRFPLVGVYFRFAHSDGQSFLSHIEKPGKAGELYVLAEFMEYKSYGVTTMKPLKRDALQDELIDLLIKKHGVTFHWGKNSDSILKRSNLKNNFGTNLDRFQQVAIEMDPKGTFQTRFMNDMLFNAITSRTFYGH